MLLCSTIVVLTAFLIGLNAILSVKSMSGIAFQTYDDSVNAGYKKEIKSQVQSAMAIVQSEYEKFQSGEKQKRRLWKMQRRRSVLCATGTIKAVISGLMPSIVH